MQKYFTFSKTVVSATRILCHNSPKFECFPRWSGNTAFKHKNIDDLNTLFDHIKDRPFHLKLLTNIYDSIDYAQVSSENACLLLNMCGEAVADSPRHVRHEACQKIYGNLLKFKSDLNIYHTYIQVCTENSVLLNTKEFLHAMKDSPSSETYKLLLRNVCEKGDVQQALEILETMKLKSMLVDEDVFNNLVLVHTIQKGLEGSKPVLKAMQIAQLPESVQTKLSIIKGIIQNGNVKEFKKTMENFQVKLEKSELLTVIATLGLNDHVSWLKDIEPLYLPEMISRDFINSLKKICIHLVSMGKYDASFNIYKHFVKPDQDENYGFFLLREMIFCQASTDKIIEFAKDLRASESNPYILHKITEVTLRHKFTDVSWPLLENFTELRPHYFWSLLIAANEKQGEGGILAAISKITKLKLKLDAESLENYVFAMCNISNHKSLMLLLEKLKTEGYTVKETLSPLLAVLLKNKKTQLAAGLCNNYNVSISGDRLITLVSSSWYSTKDKKSCITLLQKYCESNNSNINNVLCEFLTETLQLCQNSDDYQKYNELIKQLVETGIKLDSTSINSMRDRISQLPDEHSEKIISTLDRMVDFGLTPETSASTFIPHPRHMSLDDLECHLVELQEKKMNVRGTLRLLILQHSKLGNSQRVQELKEMFNSSNFSDSPGMKSLQMQKFVKDGKLEQALEAYSEIKRSNPNFKIDTYKVIDLCCLLVKEDKFDEALSLLKDEPVLKKNIQKDITRNCLELLKAFKDEKQQHVMFNFLTENGYCEINNVMLGPLIRIHLNRGDVQKAVDTYINLSKKYRRTPLQLELIKEVVKTRDNDTLQKIINATISVHGTISTQATLIVALAENGMKKALDKFLTGVSDPSIQSELKKRCDRWVQEGKSEALRNLIECCMRFNRRILDVEYAAMSVMKLYSLNGSYKEALEIFEFLEQNDIYNEDIKRQLRKLLKDNKQDIPEWLRMSS